MSTDMEPGLMYRCIKRSQVRKDSSKSSEKVAVLNIGDIIEVLAVHKLPNGVLRIQCVAGWISWVAANGDRTLEAVDTSHVMPAEYSENVTVPAAHALGKDFPHRQTAEEKKAAATTAHEAHLYHHRHPPHLVKQVLDVFHAGVAKYDKTPAEARGIQTVLSDDVIVQLKSIFEDMDIDHSGAIDVEDVIPILKQFSVTDDTERLIQIIDDNEDGFVDFREFLCVYLSAASRGELSYSSPGFTDMLARLERHTKLSQIETMVSNILRVSRSESTSNGDLANILSELVKLSHSMHLDDDHKNVEKALIRKNAHESTSLPSTFSGMLRVENRIEQILDYEAALHEDTDEEQALLEDLSPEEAEIERARMQNSDAQRAFHLAKLISLFPTLGARKVEAVFDEAGNARTAVQLLKDISGEMEFYDELNDSALAIQRVWREKMSQKLSADSDAALAESVPPTSREPVCEVPEAQAPEPEAQHPKPEVQAPEPEVQAPEPDAEGPDPETQLKPAQELGPKLDLMGGDANITSDESELSLTAAYTEFVDAVDVVDIDRAWNKVLEKCKIKMATGGLTILDGIYKNLRRDNCPDNLMRILKILQKQIDLRISKKCSLEGHRAIVIGAGPIGLRCAVELAMCGAQVTLVEQRRSFTRANILKLWPFFVHDMRNLGAKIFFPQFCTGALMHIGTKRLQQILLKDALLLGVDVQYGLEFMELLPPDATNTDWHVLLQPRKRGESFIDPPELLATTQETGSMLMARGFDSVFLGMGQKEPIVTNPGTKNERLHFPGPLRDNNIFEIKKVQYSKALGLVTHFRNSGSTEELCMDEQPGIARQFNLAEFNSLKDSTMAELENVVYYRGETHYWVMTPTEESLIKTGVFTRLGPSREEMLEAATEALRDAIKFCFGESETNQVITDPNMLLEKIDALAAEIEPSELPVLNKVLRKLYIDAPRPAAHAFAKAQTGYSIQSRQRIYGAHGAEMQAKEIKKLGEALFGIAEEKFPPERQAELEKVPRGTWVFVTHGRKGAGAKYVVDRAKLQEYARNVAGHFRTYFKTPKPGGSAGEYLAPFTEDGAAQIFNFDQILESLNPSAIIPSDNGPAVSVHLIGDSMKEPFWPQGTGVNRGVLGAFDAIWMQVLAVRKGLDLRDEAVRHELLAERDKAFRECRNADTPYPKDGFMAEFKSGRDSGSYWLDPSSRYKRLMYKR